MSCNNGVESDVSPSCLAFRAIDAVKQSLGSELEFDIFLVLDGREVRFVMEPGADEEHRIVVDGRARFAL